MKKMVVLMLVAMGLLGTENGWSQTIYVVTETPYAKLSKNSKTVVDKVYVEISCDNVSGKRFSSDGYTFLSISNLENDEVVPVEHDLQTQILRVGKRISDNNKKPCIKYYLDVVVGTDYKPSRARVSYEITDLVKEIKAKYNRYVTDTSDIQTVFKRKSGPKFKNITLTFTDRNADVNGDFQSRNVLFEEIGITTITIYRTNYDNSDDGFFDD